MVIKHEMVLMENTPLGLDALWTHRNNIGPIEVVLAEVEVKHFPDILDLVLDMKIDEIYARVADPTLINTEDRVLSAEIVYVHISRIGRRVLWIHFVSLGDERSIDPLFIKPLLPLSKIITTNEDINIIGFEGLQGRCQDIKYSTEDRRSSSHGVGILQHRYQIWMNVIETCDQTGRVHDILPVSEGLGITHTYKDESYIKYEC